MTTRNNMADQAIDVAGTQFHSDSLNKSDEPLKLGKPIILGSSASLSGSAPYITVSGLSGLSPNSKYNFITIENANNINNNGTYPIVDYINSSTITIYNDNGVGGDLNNGNIYWIERQPWSAEDDHNFHRTDRADIKGVGYDQPIPSYVRCVDQNTPIPTNLLNIAGKTTDARAFVDNIKFIGLNVSLGDSFVTLSSPGNLKHADPVNITGVPVSDGYDSGNYEATFVGLINGDGYGEITVLRTVEGGIEAGWKVYGITRSGNAISPDSIEIEFRAVPTGGSFSESLPYTWEIGQINTIDVIIGYRTCLYNLSEVAFRKNLIQKMLYETGEDLPTPTGVGQVLMSIDGNRYIPAMPVTSIHGWLVNDEGILIVNDIYGEVE